MNPPDISFIRSQHVWHGVTGNRLTFLLCKVKELVIAQDRVQAIQVVKEIAIELKEKNPDPAVVESAKLAEATADASIAAGEAEAEEEAAQEEKKSEQEAAKEEKKADREDKKDTTTETTTTRWTTSTTTVITTTTTAEPTTTTECP